MENLKANVRAANQVIQREARQTGFDYRTLLTRIENPDQMRLYELKVLAGVLKISDDILEIVKGAEK